MKTSLLILSLVFLISCNDSQKNKTEVETAETQTTTVKKQENSNGMLAQNGDYSSLFKREANDCSFLSTQVIADALKMDASMINKGINDCTFNLVEANGNKTRFYFRVQPWENKLILREIKSAKENAEQFGKDSKLSQYKISETGDTYLSMHQNRMIRVMNETADGIIVISYFDETQNDGTDMEGKNQRKEIARERAYDIANFLLKSHQK